MYLTIQKWGNSLGLRLPKTLAKQVNVHQGSQVDVSLKDNKIILVPKEAKYNLNDLMKKVSKTNVHKEISFGKIAGKEIW